jgi:hypothetical protein
LETRAACAQSESYGSRFELSKAGLCTLVTRVTSGPENSYLIPLSEFHIPAPRRVPCPDHLNTLETHFSYRIFELVLTGATIPSGSLLKKEPPRKPIKESPCIPKML